jgi:hypothetical protein
MRCALMSECVLSLNRSNLSRPPGRPTGGVEEGDVAGETVEDPFGPFPPQAASKPTAKRMIAA